MLNTRSFRRMDWAWRISVAHILTLMLLLLSLVAIPLPYASDLRPSFLLMGVYYWAVYRPTLLPPVFTFILGILLDLLSGLPIGLNAFVLLAAQWIIRDQRRFLMGQPYMVVWTGFAFICLFTGLCQWIIQGFFMAEAVGLQHIVMNMLVSIFIFPIITLFFITVHRILPIDRHFTGGTRG